MRKRRFDALNVYIIRRFVARVFSPFNIFGLALMSSLKEHMEVELYWRLRMIIELQSERFIESGIAFFDILRSRKLFCLRTPSAMMQ